MEIAKITLRVKKPQLTLTADDYTDKPSGLSVCDTCFRYLFLLKIN